MESIDTLATVRLVDHRVIHGRVRDIELAGGRLLRVDRDEPQSPATEYFGPAAIFSISPDRPPEDVDDDIIELPQEAPPATPEAAPEPARKRPKTTARVPTQIKPDHETFADLLEHLDSSFQTYTIPEIKDNWLPKSDIAALKRLGIFVPSPWLLELTEQPSLPTEFLFPSIAACAMGTGKSDNANIVHPRFIYAFREPRLPPGIEPCPGIPYRFGFCVELNEKENTPDSPPRLFWEYCWLVVKPDGTIYAPRERRPVEFEVSQRNPRYRLRRHRTPSVISYVSPAWRRQTTLTDSESKLRPQEYERFSLCIFRQLLLWWADRDNRWSVGVRKDDARVTFSIAKEHTAAYFADRDKTVNAHGVTRKIIHYVREHQRVNGSTVREHLRGLREFDWRGYHCLVTAPKLNGFVATTASLEPIRTDRPGPDELTTAELAAKLADLEDYGPTRAGF
jgi:hypothetical protein